MVYLRIEKNGKRVSQPVLHTGEYFVGRDPGCEIRLDHPGISRRHARLACSNGRLSLIDLGSCNGTFVNDKRVKQQEITHGDTVKLAAYTLTIEDGKKADTAKVKRDDKKIGFGKAFYSKYACGAVVALVAGISFYAFSVGHDGNRNHSQKATPSAEKLPPTEAPDSTLADIELMAPETIENDSLSEPSPLLAKTKHESAAMKISKPLLPASQEMTHTKGGTPALQNKKAVTRKEREQGGRSAKPTAQIANAGHTPPPPVTPSPGLASTSVSELEPIKRSDKPTLTPEQRHEAEKLYWQAYQIMQYKNKNALLQALVLLKKAQEAAPDSRFKYYIKAQTKIDLLMKELVALEN